MTFDAILSKYLEINLLLAISFCAWKSLAWFQKSTTHLKQGYLAIAASLVLPFIAFRSLFPEGEFKFTPPVQIWSDAQSLPGLPHIADSIAFASPTLAFGKSSLWGFKLVAVTVIFLSCVWVLSARFSKALFSFK